MVSVWAKRITANVCTWLSDTASPACGQVPILTYHRIAPYRRGVPRPTWNVPPERFHEQLSGLLKRGFEPLRIGQLLKIRQAGQDPPSKCFVVTFDDVYQTTFTNALPILRDLHVPVSLFIATKYIDWRDPFPFDDWVARGSAELVEDWLPQTRQTIDQAMEDPLIEIGAHGHRHTRFGSDASGFRDDLELCLEILRKNWSVTSPAFSFPFGVYNQSLVDATKDAGTCCALTSDPDAVSVTSAPWGWGRFGVHDWDTAETILTRAAGIYASLRSVCKAGGRKTPRTKQDDRPTSATMFESPQGRE